MEKQIYIARQNWLPIEKCKYEEGEWFLVMEETGRFIKVQASKGCLWKRHAGDNWEIVTDAVKFIYYPREDYFEAEAFATNDIPTEFVLPYIKRARDKAIAALEKERVEHQQQIAKYKAQIAERGDKIFSLETTNKRLQKEISGHLKKIEEVRAESLKDGAKRIVKFLNVLLCSSKDAAVNYLKEMPDIFMGEEVKDEV